MDKDRAQNEYAAQFFKFVPRSLVDEISEESNNLVQEGLELIKNQITKRYAGKVDSGPIDESARKIEEKYLLEMDKIFDKLASFLCAHVLRVPPHVLLDEDKVWEPSVSSGSSSKLTNINIELDSLRKNIKTAIYKKSVLKQSLENIQEIVTKQEEQLKADEEMFNNYNVQDWKSICEFTKQNRDSLNKRMMLLDKLVGGDKSEVQEDKISLLSKHKKFEKDRNCNDYFDKLAEEF